MLTDIVGKGCVVSKVFSGISIRKIKGENETKTNTRKKNTKVKTN